MCELLTGDGDVDLPGVGGELSICGALKRPLVAEGLQADRSVAGQVHQSRALAAGRLAATQTLHVERYVVHARQVGLEGHTHTQMLRTSMPTAVAVLAADPCNISVALDMSSRGQTRVMDEVMQKLAHTRTHSLSGLCNPQY